MMTEETQTLHAELVQTLRAILQGHSNFRDALGLDEEKVVALAVYAREMVEQGQLDDAQALLEGLVSLDPQNGYLHTCLGAVYMQKGSNDAAMAEFAYALQQDPEDIAANVYLGELYLEGEDIEAAVPYLEKAVALDPDARDPYGNRARALAAVVATIAREVQERGPEALQEIRQRAAGLQQEGSA